MAYKKSVFLFACLLSWSILPVSYALGDDGCRDDWRPVISFVEFQSLDLEQQQSIMPTITGNQSLDLEHQPPAMLTIKGKLKLPVRYHWRKRCFVLKRNVPAVVILHGSAGVDFRGDFYARALNAFGIATLEVDMWEARGIDSAADRPPLPLFTYPDAFGALRFLSEHPNIDPGRIGILGFSWGGVVTMASATELYTNRFGGGRRFAAHVAHYPICYGYNSPLPGSEFFNLTGAPLLIQIGENDGYDNGSAPCFVLRGRLDPVDQRVVEVTAYEDAYHAWDRLEVPITIDDPFSNRGLGGKVELIPDPDAAYESRRKVVKFFRRNL